MNFYKDALIPMLMVMTFSGPGLECASYASPIEKRQEEAYDISEAMRDFEYISKEQARKILRDNGVDGMDILEYMTAFPWTDELVKICEEFGADKGKVPLYQAMIFAESSGNPEACSEDWFARGLMQVRYAGAFDEIWQLVYSDKARFKRLRRTHPRIHAYFKEVFRDVEDPLAFWYDKMVHKDKDTFDPEFGMRIGVAYLEILDSEDHLPDPEYDDLLAVLKYLSGPTKVAEDVDMEMKKGNAHISKVRDKRKSFDELNRVVASSIKQRNPVVARNYKTVRK
jgi:hypothetical protein